MGNQTLARDTGMCSSRKNPYPPHRRSSEIPRGREVLKVKILEAKYSCIKLNWNFLGGGGCKKKNFPWGVWIFSVTAQSKKNVLLNYVCKLHVQCTCDYPQFSFWIPTFLAKICFSHIVIKCTKIPINTDQFRNSKLLNFN